MKYNAGDKVRIKSLDWYNENKGNADKTNSVWCGAWFFYHMSQYCGKIMTIENVWANSYKLEGSDSIWTDEMIEGLVEEETKPEFDYVAAMEDLMGLDIEKSCILNEFDEYKKAVEEHGFFSEEALSCKYFIHLRKIGTAQNILEKFGFNLPEGYIFKDENGNEILTSKIILEKKQKYPKTYEECCKIIYSDPKFYVDTHLYSDTLGALYKLLICRNAYWRLAGDEMGLGKPWEPDWKNSEEKRYSIVNIEGDINLPEKTLTKWILKVTNKILVFPTEEMRDAFYENFKSEIEICKELL